MADVRALNASQYLLLTTFRRDGRAVATPLWVAADDAALYVWTPAGAGKVKRIRNSGDVTVAPCDVRGKPSAEPVAAHAALLDADETERVRALLRRKYGIMGRLVLLGSRLRRGPSGTVGIRITLA
jgi:PPOX class probable F420-dependent enzyme